MTELAFLSSDKPLLTKACEYWTIHFDQQEEEGDHYDSLKALLWDYVLANVYRLQVTPSLADEGSDDDFPVLTDARAKKIYPGLVRLLSAWKTLKSSAQREAGWGELDKLIAEELPSRSGVGSLACLLLARDSVDRPKDSDTKTRVQERLERAREQLSTAATTPGGDPHDHELLSAALELIANGPKPFEAQRGSPQRQSHPLVQFLVASN